MYNYRCSKSKCRKRVTLRMKVEWYKVERYRFCPACKCDSLKIDLAVKRHAKADTCRCDGLPYPHKRKSRSGNYICKQRDAFDEINFELGASKINSRIKEPF